MVVSNIPKLGDMQSIPNTREYFAVQTQHFSQGRKEILQLITPLFYPTLFTKKYGGDEFVVDGFKNMQLLGRDMGLEPCGFAPRSSKYYSVLQYCFLSFSNSSCHLNW